jgi:hypothetical protein
MKTEPPHSVDLGDEVQEPANLEVVRQIVRAVQNVHYGSVEVIIQNSRVVQIERKEKFRFDKPQTLTRTDREKS